jgi:glycosyltransferase involved in cell wall biosynthesis
MKRERKLRIAFYAILLLLIFLVGYKVYLYFFETDFEDLNAKNTQSIQEELQGKPGFSFAVIGNIHNSIGIFDKKIVPRLNQEELDFLLSTGNSVSNGADNNYRVLYRSLQKLDIPYVLAFGENEQGEFDSSNFYEHFGPFYFSFQLQDAYFIFLDTTGETSLLAQKDWLLKELEYSKRFQHCFLLLNKPPFKIPGQELQSKEAWIQDSDFREFLQQNAAELGVDAVFASNLATYNKQSIQGVPYYVSGGGGGLLLDQQENSYHYLQVDVGQEGISVQKVDTVQQPSQWLRQVEHLWLFIRSIFYVGALNFLLLLCLLALLALKLYSALSRQRVLYRDFSRDEEEYLGRRLKIAMFTNNYLPFVGGVPISIYRLLKGLISLGHAVKIFAPEFKEDSSRLEEHVFRCKPILFYSKFANLPIANRFSPQIGRAFQELAPDIVHLHHPFWMGKKGFRLASKHNIPIIYTYHTRLDKYSHYALFSGTLFRILLAHYVIKRFADKCDGIIVPAYSIEEYLRNLGVSTLVETIPTGVETECFKGLDQDQVQSLRRQYAEDAELLLLCVTRISQEKNLYFLLQGLQQVSLSCSRPFKCLLAGDGPELQGLKDYARELGVDGQVIFLGQVEQRHLPLFYTASDLFVFSSTSETQGMVLLEAMAGGCPVVAVRSSGIAEVVQNGYNGYKTSENVKAWAETVLQLMQNQQEMQRMSKNARQQAESFSVEKTAQQVLSFYARVLAAKGRAGS